MNLANTSTAAKSSAMALGVQAGLAALALVAALSPRPGAAALYVPLAQQAALPVGQHGLIALARGPLPHSLFVRTTDAKAALYALRHGALLVAAPDPSCSSSPSSPTQAENRSSKTRTIADE